MRVLFDHQIADARAAGGISRYVSELVAHLRAQDLAQAVFPPLLTDNPHLRPLLQPESYRGDDRMESALRLVARLRLSVGELRRLRRRWRARRNRRAGIAVLRAGAYDVFHPTYYDPYFLPHLGGRPFVLTVYDMIHETFPELFAAADPTAARKALLVERAAAVIAISAATADELAARLAVDRGKIDVIHLGAPAAPPSEPIAVPSRYLLFVGARARYKNFARLLRAFAALAPAHPDLHLVSAHGPAPGADERAAAAALGVGERWRHLEPSDAQLTYLYANAALLACPSLAEGFGLPVVEAFAAGCPVACSDTSCFPEIAGDAATTFDPLDEGSIAHALSRLLTDEAWRATAIARGSDRARRFRWETTARQTAAVYARCCGENAPAR